MNEKIHNEHLTPLSLNSFRDNLKELVREYVSSGNLRTQEDVDAFAHEIGEARKIMETRDGNGARVHVLNWSLERFGKPMDLYNDPEDRYGMKGVTMSELLEQLVELSGEK